MRARFWVGAIVVGFMLAGGAVFAKGELKAGTGRVVITPKQDMWMAGYAARREPSKGKVHDLYARALAIEDETGARSVFVSTDLLGLTRTISSRVAEIAKEKFGIERANLLLTASHTHCGPVVRENLIDMYPLNEEQKGYVNEYTDALPGLIAEAIGQALANMEPCDFSWGIGEAGFAINRREFKGEGVVIGQNAKGPIDHDVPVLAAKRGDGSVKAVVFGYACHNTTLSFQQFCGDYAGFAQLHLEEKLPGATALFFSGCGGDQNPHPRGELVQAEQYGRELGDAVLAVTREAMKPAAGPIEAKYREIALKLSVPPTREELEKQAADPSNVYVQRRAQSLLRRLEADGKLETTYPYPIQIWQFGEGLRMVALGGEVVVDYSLRLKKELGEESNFIIGYANDVMAYIPSLRILKEGGYEGGGAMVYYGLYGPWAEEVEEHIVRTVHEMAQK